MKSNLSQTEVNISTTKPGIDRPFDDYVFVNYCINDHGDTLKTLLEVEKRYQYSSSECASYCQELDSAAGISGQYDQNADWRYRIARWLLKASDELMLSRETALIALSYCDRFTMTRRVKKHLLQMASITSLFIASKIFEKRPIRMAALLAYTQNRFKISEIVKMEQDILTSNNSYMYPPTANTFLLILLNGISCKSDHIKVILESAQFMIELASCDFFFLSYRRSIIAKIAIEIVFEQDSQLSDTTRGSLEHTKALDLDMENVDIKCCVERLRKVVDQNQLLITAIANGDNAHKNIAANNKTEDHDLSAGRVTPSPTGEIMSKFDETKSKLNHPVDNTEAEEIIKNKKRRF